MKHTGEPRDGLALPFEQEARLPSVAVGALIVVGIVALPLLYDVLLAVFSAPVAMALSLATVVLMLGLAFLGGRLAYST